MQKTINGKTEAETINWIKRLNNNSIILIYKRGRKILTLIKIINVSLRTKLLYFYLEGGFIFL